MAMTFNMRSEDNASSYTPFSKNNRAPPWDQRVNSIEFVMHGGPAADVFNVHDKREGEHMVSKRACERGISMCTVSINSVPGG